MLNLLVHHVTSRLQKVQLLQEGEYHGRLDFCQQISSKITKSHDFLEDLTFLIRQISKLLAKSKAVFGKGEIPRSPATWKSRPKIVCLMCPQEVRNYKSFILHRSNSQWWKFPCSVAIFPLPWTTSLKPFWQNHVSARRGNLPLCCDCARLRNDCFATPSGSLELDQ